METRAAPSGSLFGRERELARIQELLDAAPNGGTGLVLEGEPGIGKTSLWKAGIDAALERGLSALNARPAEAERELSFSALGDLLAPTLDRLEALSPPRRHALEVALLLTPDESEAPDARALGLATLDVLRSLAADGPLIVALDDTQWLDPPSRETLAYALRRLEREPVALLTACRPGTDALVLGDTGRIDVGPLSIGALHELIRNRPDGAITRPTLVRVQDVGGESVLRARARPGPRRAGAPAGRAASGAGHAERADRRPVRAPWPEYAGRSALRRRARSPDPRGRDRCRRRTCRRGAGRRSSGRRDRGGRLATSVHSSAARLGSLCVGARACAGTRASPAGRGAHRPGRARPPPRRRGECSRCRRRGCAR